MFGGNSTGGLARERVPGPFAAQPRASWVNKTTGEGNGWLFRTQTTHWGRGATTTLPAHNPLTAHPDTLVHSLVCVGPETATN